MIGFNIMHYFKKNILHLIKNTPYTFKNITTYTRFKFWIEQDYRCKQYQMIFCSRCGNYVCNHTNYEYEKIQCKCNLITKLYLNSTNS